MKLRKLVEEFTSGVKYQGNYYEIFKNPSTKELKNIVNEQGDAVGDGIRGFVSYDGDLYVVSPNLDLLHDDILLILSKEKILPLINRWWYTNLTGSHKYFLAVISDGTKLARWLVSESYFFEEAQKPPQEYIEHYKKIMKSKGKKLLEQEVY